MALGWLYKGTMRVLEGYWKGTRRVLDGYWESNRKAHSESIRNVPDEYEKGIRRVFDGHWKGVRMVLEAVSYTHLTLSTKA